MPKSKAAYLVNDLLWDSRIRAAARAQGASAVRVHAWSDLDRMLGSGDLGLVLVDLEHPSAGQLVAQTKTILAAGVQVVAWGPHVASDPLAQAREAGIGLVLTRGAFAQRLESILKSLVAEQAGD